MKPLCIDLFAGLGGWTKGFLAEGYRVIGFDVERHAYGEKQYPAQLVLQDVLTLHGSQFKDAACIVASPPCQAYSYMAMPWSRAKAMAKDIRQSPARIEQLNALFNACFRIQMEASQAAGHHIPLVVENVNGAQPWVGRANANFGSFYLWGDVASVGGRIVAAHRVKFGAPTLKAFRAVKVPGMNWSGSDKPGYKAVAFNDEAARQLRDGRKVPTYSDPRRNGGKGVHLTSPRENGGGIKQPGHSGRAWFADPDVAGHFSSKSDSRKAASAMIAEIPMDLSRWIARCFLPEEFRSNRA